MVGERVRKLKHKETEMDTDREVGGQQRQLSRFGWLALLREQKVKEPTGIQLMPPQSVE